MNRKERRRRWALRERREKAWEEANQFAEEVGGTRTRSKPVPRVPLLIWRKIGERKRSKLAYSVQAIDLIGAP